MPLEIIIILTDEEVKVCEASMIQPIPEWTENAVRNKIRKSRNRIVESVTDRNAKKVSLAEQITIIEASELETAVDREARELQEMIDRANK